MGRKAKITVLVPWSGYSRTMQTDGFYKMFLYKYPSYAEVISKRFEAYTGRPMHWDELNSMSLTRFRDGCATDMCGNTAVAYCKMMAAVIRIYGDTNHLDYTVMRSVLSMKSESGRFAYVTEDDMEKIIQFYYYTFNDPVKVAVAAVAIVEFYTGARLSDIVQMSDKNIESRNYIERETGELKTIDMITYTSQKTKIKASMPVKPVIRHIFMDRRFVGVRLTTEVVDRVIKVICRRVGLTRMVRERRRGVEYDRELCECVSSHTFRRSFATALDRKGVGIDTISRMMGHTNTKQTRGYICGDTSVLDEAVMSFFK